MAYWRLILRVALITSVICVHFSRQDGEVVTESETNEVATTETPFGNETSDGQNAPDTTAGSLQSEDTKIGTPEPTTQVPESITEKGPPKLNILFTYEDPTMKKVIDMGLETIQGRLKKADKGYELGTVQSVTTATKNNDAIKVVTELCRQVDAVRPDLVVDFTKFGIPSESVKVIAKAIQIPTVSASIGGPGDIREWRNLSPSEAKYLVQLNPPEDFALRVIRNLAREMKIPDLVIFHSEEFEMFHHQRTLLQDVPTKHVIVKLGKTENEIRRQLVRSIAAFYSNYIIAGSLEQIDAVLKIATSFGSAGRSDLFDEKHSWYSLSLDDGSPSCKACTGKVNLVHIQPALARAQETQHTDSKDPRHAFHLNLVVDAIEAAGHLKANGSWPDNKPAISCVNYKIKEYPEIHVDIRGALQTVHTREAGVSEPFYEIRENGESHTPLVLRLLHIKFDGSASRDEKVAGYWRHTSIGYEMALNGTSLTEHVAQKRYRVVTVVQPPFVYKNQSCGRGRKLPPSCYYGYSIDILNALAKGMKFDYTIFDVKEYGFMQPHLPHEWNGMVRELQDQEADIAVGAFSVYPEREKVMDFTARVYGMVGYQILMRKDKQVTALFKFLTVLENDVWMCIFGAFFFTSILMWIFDRWSPYSYQNNKEKYEDDEEKREFTLRESLWFCMTSLTPQGGGEAPKNLSGRLVAATWWLFGFIIIASYTANLAAFLTVSRLEKPIESLNDLIKQYKVQYAPVVNSSAWFYFDRMANVEHLFYEVWKDMSLNDSLTEFERSAFAVWEYPVSDKFTKIWQSFIENKPPEDVTTAVNRVKWKDPIVMPNGTVIEQHSEMFAWIAEATEIRYHHMTNCMVRIVGDEFSMNPYAFGVQKGSPLKEEISKEIRKLEHLRLFEMLDHKWWDKNPDIPRCSKYDDLADGISLHNIGGVFTVIAAGFTMTIIATILEFWWYKRVNNAHDMSETGSEVAVDIRGTSAAFEPIQRADYSVKYSEDT